MIMKVKLWEESVGSFKHTFSFLRHKTRFDQNLVSATIAETFFKKEFSKDIQSFIDLPFFKEGEFYSTKKLEA